mgnify:CR=1 FL=1
MEDLLAKVQLKYPNFEITRRHLNRVVNDNNITLKMTRFRHEPVKRFGKEININSKIKEFYDKEQEEIEKQQNQLTNKNQSKKEIARPDIKPDYSFKAPKK